MIILFDENEQEFTTLGIGILSDASSCIITEELNGGFELEMEYPVSGAHYNDLKLKRLILAKPNDIMQPQPFRIYRITRPIDGIVTVNAEHISYDMSRVPIKALNANDLDELIVQIQNRKMISSPFTFNRGSDKGNVQTSFKTKVPYSFRALLGGEEGSILDTYTGEYVFDRYSVVLMNRRGADRDFTIRYSKNMTDLEHESSSENMVSGICPYYSNTTTETKTVTSKKYKEAYVSKEAGELPEIYDQDGVRIYQSKYVSYNDGGSGIAEILTYSVTNIIATDGDMLNHLIRARKVVAQGTTEEAGYIYDVTYKMAYINKDSQNEFGSDWLYEDPELTRRINPTEWNPSLNPYASNAPIYRIFTPGDKMYNVYIWKYDSKTSAYKYQEPVEEDNIETYPPQMPSVGTESEEKDNIILYEGNIIYVNEVRAVPDGVEYTSTWLRKITEENIQGSSQDPRWVLGDIITPVEGINYKVAVEESPIRAYYNAGDLSYGKEWLYSDAELTTLIIPIDGKAYVVTSKEPKTLGRDFYYRWSDYDQKYNPKSDTRYEYTNYIWDGLQYVERNTSSDAIITFDVTDKFTDTPKNNQKFQKQIYDETIKYIKEQKLGEVKDSIKVSFIKLSSSPEYSKWKELEKVELGDTVHVIYEDLGLNVTKKVTKTEFNVLTDSYDSIELGEKSSKFTNGAIVEGDNISSLTNDRNFADDTTVTNLFAKYISADYLKSINAEITEAQIATLTSDSITANLIEAERFEIDQLVAGLMIADNAAIRETLTAGEIVVNGEINVKSGSIAITKDEIEFLTTAYVMAGTEEYSFYWLKLHQSDTESLIPDTETVYKVYDTNNLFKGYYKWSTDGEGLYVSYNPEVKTHFYVDEDGNLEANSATIKGTITALAGQFGSGSDPDKIAIINEQGYLEVPFANITGTVVAHSLVIGAEIKNVVITNDGQGFSSITGASISDGTMNGTDISGGSIDESSITDTDIQNGTVDQSTGKAPFEVASDGTVYIREGSIKLGTIGADNKAAFDVDNNGNVFIREGDITMNQGEINLGPIYDEEDPSTVVDYNFSVDNNGYLKATSLFISNGVIETKSGKLEGISSITADTLKVKDIIIDDDNPSLSLSDIDISDTLTIGNVEINDGTLYTIQTSNALTVSVKEIYVYNTDNIVGDQYYNQYCIVLQVNNYPSNAVSNYKFSIQSFVIIFEFENGDTVSYFGDRLFGTNYTVTPNDNGLIYIYDYYNYNSKMSRIVNHTEQFTYDSTYNKVQYKVYDSVSSLAVNCGTLYGFDKIGTSSDRITEAYIESIYCTDVYADNIVVPDLYANYLASKDIDIRKKRLGIHDQYYDFRIPMIFAGTYILSKSESHAEHNGWYYLNFNSIATNIGSCYTVDDILCVIAIHHNTPGRYENLAVWWGDEGTGSYREWGIFIGGSDDSKNEFDIIVILDNN